MIVYVDLISGDEVLSDAFTLKQVVDKDGAIVEGLMFVESKMIKKSDDDIDVGCGNAFGGDEEGEAGGDSGVAMVNNVVDGFQYTETQIGTANDFKAWIKEYMNAIVTKLRESGKPKEEIQAFKGQAAGIAKFFLTNFSELQFYLGKCRIFIKIVDICWYICIYMYIGPSFVADSMVFSIYPEGATTPNFYYIMGGLKASKF